MTRADWVWCVAVLAAAYPKEPLTPAQQALYWSLFQDVPGDIMRQAVLRHVQGSPWFPRVSELQAAVSAVQAPVLDDAESAWGKVLAEVRRVGWMGTPTWDDPVIAETLRDLGWVGIGWRDFCASTNPEADRAHFVRWYRQVQARQHAQTQDQTALAALDRLGLSLASIGRLAEGGADRG